MVEVRGTGPYRGGQDVDAPDFNVLSDALDDLAGRNGVADRNGSLTVLDGPSGDRFVDLPSSATEPGSPEDGWVYFDTADDLLRWYNGGAWRDQADGVAVVTYGNLNANGDVGTNANQVSRGNHTH